MRTLTFTPARRRVVAMAASLGVDADTAAGLHTHRLAALRPVASRIAALARARPGLVVLITGPSGSGKSSLLKLVERAAGARRVRSLPARNANSWVAALLPGTPLAAWAATLARFGLADAAVLVSRVRTLSAGEVARLELALAAQRAATAHCRCITADEWCSLLDRESAASVSRGTLRWARSSGISVVAATASSDLCGIADVVVTLDFQGGATWGPHGWNKAG